MTKGFYFPIEEQSEKSFTYENYNDIYDFGDRYDKEDREDEFWEWVFSGSTE